MSNKLPKGMMGTLFHKKRLRFFRKKERVYLKNLQEDLQKIPNKKNVISGGGYK